MILFSHESEEAKMAVARIKRALMPAGVLTFALAFAPILLVLFIMLQFAVASPGRSLPTVVGLLLIVSVVLVVAAALSVLRERVLAQIGAIAISCVSPRLHQATGALVEKAKGGAQQAGQITADLDAILQFTRSGALAGWLDLATVPVLLLFMVLLHGWLALLLIVICVLYGLLLSSTVLAIHRPRRQAQLAVARRRAFLEENRTRQDILRGLGAVAHVEAAWQALNIRVLNFDSAWRTTHSRNVALARHLRLFALCAVIALGTFLQISGLAVPSVVVAAGFVTWLALRPCVAAIETVWLLIDVRQGWARIDGILKAVPIDPVPLPLPAPTDTISGEEVAIAAPGTRRVILHNVNFRLERGNVLAVLGSSGAGKSVLLRAIAGAWPVLGGKIRLDGAALDQWSNEQVGRHIGYLPQSVELFDGTVAENIARFRPDVTGEMVVRAAQRALAHDMILSLPDGYDTLVGANGRLLSGSQAQRIGLARALLGDPFLLVLDEPTAYSDRDGATAFNKVVETARDEGCIVVVGGGAPALAELATHVLMVDRGTGTYFGETEAVRKAVLENKVKRNGQSETLAAKRSAGSD